MSKMKWGRINQRHTIQVRDRQWEDERRRKEMRESGLVKQYQTQKKTRRSGSSFEALVKRFTSG